MVKKFHDACFFYVHVDLVRKTFATELHQKQARVNLMFKL